MITIIDKQKCRLDNLVLKSTMKSIITNLGYPRFDVGMLLVDSNVMKEINKKYRGKNTPTDVLAFRFHETIKPEEIFLANTDDDRNLGDIILCPEYIIANTKTDMQSNNKQILKLVVHAICHLAGYDHEKDEAYHVMQKKEDAIVQSLGKVQLFIK